MAERFNVINYNRPGPLKISEAKSLIQEYLREHIPDFENRNFVQLDSYIEDPLWKEEWREKPKPPEQHSVFENWVSRELDNPHGDPPFLVGVKLKTKPKVFLRPWINDGPIKPIFG